MAITPNLTSTDAAPCPPSNPGSAQMVEATQLEQLAAAFSETRADAWARAAEPQLEAARQQPEQAQWDAAGAAAERARGARGRARADECAHAAAGRAQQVVMLQASEAALKATSPR